MHIDVDFPKKLKPLFEPQRYKVAYGGRGAGKSWGFARALILLASQHKLRILCTREVQKSIKDSVHKLLQDQIEEMGFAGQFRVLETEIRGRNGSEFLFAGLSTLTVDSIKSYEGIDRVWCEEAHAISKRSWTVLIPTIRKEGSEIWVSLNPELDTDDTYTRFIVNTPPDTVLMPMNWRDNPWFSELMRKEKDHLKATDPEEYENVWEGKPNAVVAGAIYKHEIIALYESQRLRQVPYDPMLKVHTVWDLGFVRMPVTLVQRQGSELRIIEYIENEGADYAGVVIELNKRKYNWGYDWLPHDAQSHSPHTGKTPQQIVSALGRSVKIVDKLEIEQGIKLARMIFPRVYVDKDKAGLLVERLKRYRRSIPTSTNEPAKPFKDENSDGSDTFRYLAVCADKMDNELNFKPFVKPFQPLDASIGY